MEHIDSCLVGPLQGWTDGADLKVTFCRFSCAAAHYTAKRIFVLWSWKLTNLRGELPDLCCISCIKQELMKHQANVEFCCFFKYKMFECIIHIQRVNHVKRINMYEQRVTTSNIQQTVILQHFFFFIQPIMTELIFYVNIVLHR